MLEVGTGVCSESALKRPPAAAAGGGELPAQLAGLQLWLDAGDMATLYQDSAGTTPVDADGQPVGRIVDKGPSQYALIQGTSSKKPTFVATGANGQPGLNFDGFDTLYRGFDEGGVSLGHALGTAVFAFIPVNQGASKMLLNAWSDASGSGIEFQVRYDDWRFLRYDDVRRVDYPNGCAFDAPHVVAMRSDGSSYFLNIDGADLVPTIGIGPDDGLWLKSPYGENYDPNEVFFGSQNDSTYWFAGVVSQALLFDTFIDGEDLSGLIQWAGNKVGMSL